MKIPLVIIGGGVIGLSIALKLNQKYPHLDFIILDTAKNLGDETSGRNSGVLHAGIYYEAGSLKHKLCLSGNKLWREMQRELDLSILECGKYIISSSAEQDRQLDDLFNKASIINKVPKLTKCENGDLEEIRKFTKCSSAFFSETTGVLDVPHAINQLEDYLYKKNIPILKENKVNFIKDEGGKGFLIETGRESFYAESVVNAAGLGAVEIRRRLGLRDIENYFVKGNYLKLRPSVSSKFYKKSLLYPIPAEDCLGLGVHTSFTYDGGLRFGPDIEEVFNLDYKMENNRIDKMFEAIKKLFPSIKYEDLSLDYCGIRPKIMKDNKIYPDFCIQGPREHGMENYFEFLGIESPGLTAAPAIAEHFLNEYNLGLDP